MFGGEKKEKLYTCKGCKSIFSSLDADRICSNCFACTGCEIYKCPSCGAEVVVKPVREINRQ
jgi:hypothetical protein